MKTEKFDLSNLRIASPCSVGWNNMTGDERMRFCASCELNVYNVAGMTEGEVRDLILRAEDRVCMRLMRRADGTVTTQDCPVGLRAYRKRVARFAGATLATVLGLFSISYGQKKESDVIDASKLKITHITNNCSAEIAGTITDSYGAVIPGAKVQLIYSDKTAWTESNAAGEFRIPNLRAGQYSLKVSQSGFKTITIKNLKLSDVECLKLDVKLEGDSETEWVGILAAEEVIETTSSSIGTSIDARKIDDHLETRFSKPYPSNLPINQPPQKPSKP